MSFEDDLNPDAQELIWNTSEKTSALNQVDPDRINVSLEKIAALSQLNAAEQTTAGGTAHEAMP